MHSVVMPTDDDEAERQWYAMRGYPDYRDGWWIYSGTKIGAHYADAVTMRDANNVETHRMGGRCIALAVFSDEVETYWRLDNGEVWSVLGPLDGDGDGPLSAWLEAARVNGRVERWTASGPIRIRTDMDSFGVNEWVAIHPEIDPTDLANVEIEIGVVISIA